MPKIFDNSFTGKEPKKKKKAEKEYRDYNKINPNLFNQIEYQLYLNTKYDFTKPVGQELYSQIDNDKEILLTKFFIRAMLPYGKTFEQISHSEMNEGRKGKDGGTITQGTGLKGNSLLRVLKAVIKRRAILTWSPGAGKVSWYFLNTDENLCIIEDLESGILNEDDLINLRGQKIKEHEALKSILKNNSGTSAKNIGTSANFFETTAKKQGNYRQKTGELPPKNEGTSAKIDTETIENTSVEPPSRVILDNIRDLKETADTEEKNAAAFSEKIFNEKKEEYVKKLISVSLNGIKIGFNKKTAEALFTTHPIINGKPIFEVIDRQIEWLPYQNGINQGSAAGILLNCIREDRAAPEGLSKAKNTEKISKDSNKYLPVLEIWGEVYNSITEESARIIITNKVIWILKGIEHADTRLSKLVYETELTKKAIKTMEHLPLEECFTENFLKDQTRLNFIFGIIEEKRELVA